MSAQARVALALSLVCGIALGAVAMMYVKNRRHSSGAGGGSAVAAGSGSSVGSAGSGSGSGGSGSALAAGSAGSGSGSAPGALDCAALTKVAEVAQKDAHMLGVRGKEIKREDKGGSAAMNLAPRYTEVTYATTLQVFPGTAAVIHEASDGGLPTEYRIDIDTQTTVNADSEHANPRQSALAKALADKVHACLPTWRTEDAEAVPDQTTFHSPDDLAYVTAGFGWGDDAGDITTVSLQVVAETAGARTDVGGSGSGSAP
jgi:hypothetical protein